MPAATTAVDCHSLLARFWLQLGWRRILLTTAIAFLLATRMLFQGSVFTWFTVEETLHGFALYFADILTNALIMVCAVSFVDFRHPEPGVARNLALLSAVIGSVAVATAMLLVAHYETGPYPPESYVVGESLRWSLLGGIVVAIYEISRRHQRHLRQLHAAELRHKIVENQMIEARIAMMEAQIEPHFLFNTLATVKRLYRTEPVGGAQMVSRLIEYLRAALPQIRHGIPTLASEIELVRAYLEILKIRMGARLAFAIEAPPFVQWTPFPAMVLITLVENAIKHGLNPSPEGGRIDICVIDAEDAVIIEVRDDGVGLHPESKTAGSGFGLANIRSRLDALYGSGASLMLESGEAQGVVARIKVAKHTARDIAATMADRAFSTDLAGQRAHA